VKVVLASGNAGKLKELAALLTPLGIDLIAQNQLGVRPAPETALTFVENAIGKGRPGSAVWGLPAFAAGSGLVVRALGGLPGIRSARYAGSAQNDTANNRKLIAALAGETDRRAYFFCALVYLAKPSDPAPMIATGEWHGSIIDEPRGTNGFGYDPHFLLPDPAATAAELPSALKNQLSHRGQAAKNLLAALGSLDLSLSAEKE